MTDRYVNTHVEEPRGNGTTRVQDVQLSSEARDTGAVIPSLQQVAHDLIVGVGEDPAREGLRETPRRVAESLAFLTEGYHLHPGDIVGDALFAEEFDDIVVVRDIEFYSLCEHHLLPFFGRVHIGYIPNGRIIGLSKLPRLVDVFARRLQVQERLTREIADCVQELLNPVALGVIVEASHLCMMMRGVEKQQSKTVTRHLLGTFHDDVEKRSEFLSLVWQDSSGRS